MRSAGQAQRPKHSAHAPDNTQVNNPVHSTHYANQHTNHHTKQPPPASFNTQITFRNPPTPQNTKNGERFTPNEVRPGSAGGSAPTAREQLEATTCHQN